MINNTRAQFNTSIMSTDLYRCRSEVSVHFAFALFKKSTGKISSANEMFNDTRTILIGEK